MPMDDLAHALQLIEDNDDEADFEGPKDPDLIRLAEVELGVSFPPTCRRFLRHVGCGDIAGLEVFGLIGADFVNSSVPNGIWLTLKERSDSALPPALVLISEVGDGTMVALDASRPHVDGECPVVLWRPGLPEGADLEVIATDFGQFLLREIGLALGP